MSNIERNVAKLICGDEFGNAVLLNKNMAITVRHCIDPHVNNQDVPIFLYSYNGKEYIKKEAILIDYSKDGDGFAILKIDCDWVRSNTFTFSYSAQPLKEYCSIGFDKDHNDKPYWKTLISNSSSHIELDDLIIDMEFSVNSKQPSYEGLSGSPILLNQYSNSIIGLVTQQKSASGHAFEILGISVKNQKELLKKYQIQLNELEHQDPINSQVINGELESSKSKYDYSWLQISDLQLFDNTEESTILEEFSRIKEKYDIKFILMTADLHHYGADYKKAIELLNNLTSLFGLIKRNVFIVPGNNDTSDFHLKKHLVSSISTNIEQDANYYIDCYEELLQGFAEYNSFITDFYGEDSVYKNAAEVSLNEWICDTNPSLGINLIHLNTALICGGNNLGKNIFNVQMLQELKGGHSEYPSIVIAHHPVSLLFESHANYLNHFITNRNVSAYLCGEMNKDRLENIKTNAVSNSSIPCIVCSKRSKDVQDSYSDLGYIVYSKIRDKNSVEVFPYSWDKKKKSFNYSSELESDAGYYEFPLIGRKKGDGIEDPPVCENDSRSVWLPDAECAVGEQTRFKKYTRTTLVNDFLSNDPSFWGLSAVKGIGKTFLLQVKRANMPSNTICIPIGVTPTENNHWGTDIIALYNTNSSERQLLKYERDILLWKYCILAYVTNQIINEDYDERAKKTIQEIRNGLNALSVSNEIKECCVDETLTTLSLIMENVLQTKNWYAIISKDYGTLAKKLRSDIKRWLKDKKKERVAIFIDKVDDAYTTSLNALDDRNMAMKYLGVSLISACNEIKNYYDNTIQVFFMIREEAKRENGHLLGESAQRKANICRPLYYKKEEQKKIFYDCISYQSPDLLFDPNYLKSKEYEKAFIGVDALCHPYVEGLKESVFDCIYRHSFDRSRDIQDYGKALTKKIHDIKAIEDERKRGEYVKTIIEKTAAILTIGTQGESDKYLGAYYDEKIYQLPEYWQDRETFISLMKMFDKNLLFGKEASKICEKFNNANRCDGECGKCHVKHFPLEILYKIGLLGRIDSHLSGYKNTYSLDFIHSRNVGNIMDKAAAIDRILDDSAYLLHPAFTKAIEAISRGGIRHFGGFLIGKNLTVNKELFTKIYSEYKQSEEKYNRTYFFQKQGEINYFE